jgi:hypothetical protein
MKRYHPISALLLAVVTLSLLVAAVGQHRYGRVEGQIVDYSGMPVSGATVYVLEDGRTPASISDETGHFVITNVTVGEHRVFAYKETEYYPNPVWSFYEQARGLDGFPIVYVMETDSLPILVRLGGKAGKLNVLVSNAKTKRPVSEAAVVVSHEGKPKTLFQPGTTNSDGTIKVLVPALVRINLTVKASGFATKSVAGIETASGEERTLSIELQPSAHR